MSVNVECCNVSINHMYVVPSSSALTFYCGAVQTANVSLTDQAGSRL